MSRGEVGKKGVGLYNRLPYYCLWPLELPLSEAACQRRLEHSQAADSCAAAHRGWKVVLGGWGRRGRMQWQSTPVQVGGREAAAGVRSGQIVQMSRGDCVCFISAVLDAFQTDTKFIFRGKQARLLP